MRLQGKGNKEDDDFITFARCQVTLEKKRKEKKNLKLKKIKMPLLGFHPTPILGLLGVSGALSI